jgi:hypothetical protein
MAEQMTAKMTAKTSTQKRSQHNQAVGPGSSEVERFGDFPEL